MTTDKELLRLKDKIEPKFYWAPNEIWELYAAEMGMDGFAVYHALRFYSARSGRCYPSIRKLAKHLSTTRYRIRKALALLEAIPLIRRLEQYEEIPAEATQTGKPERRWAPYIYEILSLETVARIRQERGGGSAVDPGVGSERTQGGSVVDPQITTLIELDLEKLDIPSSVEEGAKPSPDLSKKKDRDAQLNHPACQIYRSLAKLTPKEAARPLLIAAYEHVGEDAFREVVAEWMANWSPQNVTGLCDRILKSGNGKRPPRGNGQRDTKQPAWMKRHYEEAIPERCEGCGQYLPSCVCEEEKREPTLAQEGAT